MSYRVEDDSLAAIVDRADNYRIRRGDRFSRTNAGRASLDREILVEFLLGKPIPMILHCPTCGAKHVDAPNIAKNWSNPPHRSHLCHQCGVIWRPADVATTGVAAIQTRGASDSP